MKILYTSAVCSVRLLDWLYKTSVKKPMYSIQKFHRLLLKGFVANHIDVQTLTTIPVSTNNHRKKSWNVNTETEDGISYKYVPFFNFAGIKQIWTFIYAFFYTLVWGINNRKEKRLICDVLNISVCFGSLLASKIIGLKSVGIVTDMPGLMVSGSNGQSFIKKTITKINKSYLNSFDYYVFLTEYMNPVINTKKRPYLIMEGLVDTDMKDLIVGDYEKQVPRDIIYAGGLYEEYGIKKLLDAFMLIDIKDVSLSLYGNGALVPYIEECCKKDKRVHYYGVLPNDKIVEEELKATLLVNPRPTDKEFTLYSFPSKTMEYMVSGTPVLTTKLPGIPDEYFEYLYIFKDESIDGFKQELLYILSLPEDVLKKKGCDARDFVLHTKNNTIQAQRIANMISQQHEKIQVH